MPKVLAALREQALIQSVESSNRIEGVTVLANHRSTAQKKSVPGIAGRWTEFSPERSPSRLPRMSSAGFIRYPREAIPGSLATGRRGITKSSGFRRKAGGKSVSFQLRHERRPHPHRIRPPRSRQNPYRPQILPRPQRSPVVPPQRRTQRQPEEMCRITHTGRRHANRGGHDKLRILLQLQTGRLG